MDAKEYYSSKGAKQVELRSHVRGREAGSHSTQPYRPTHCAGVTKVGAACQARPIKGQALCAGHDKQARALFKGEVAV